MDSNKKFYGFIWLAVILYSLLTGHADARPAEANPLDDVDSGVHLFEGTDERLAEDGLLDALLAHCDRIEYGFQCEKGVLVSTVNEVAASNNFDLALETDANGVISVHHAIDPEDRQLIAIASYYIFLWMLGLFSIIANAAAFITYTPNEIRYGVPKCNRPASHLMVAPNFSDLYGGLESFADKCFDEVTDLKGYEILLEPIDQFVNYGDQIYDEHGPLDAKVKSTWTVRAKIKESWKAIYGNKDYILAGITLVKHLAHDCSGWEEFAISIGVNYANEKITEALIEDLIELAHKKLGRTATQDYYVSYTTAKKCETNKDHNRNRRLISFSHKEVVFADDDWWFDDDDW